MANPAFDPRDAQAEKPKAYEHAPYDIDMEQAIIGCCLRDNSLIDQAAETLDGAHFYDPLHGRIWDCMTYLQTECEVTPLTLNATMKSDPGVIETGGVAYFEALAAAAPAMRQVKVFAGIIVDLAQRRAMIDAGSKLVAAAHEPPQDAPTHIVLDAFQVAMDQIANAGPTVKRRPVRAAAAVSSMLSKIHAQATAQIPHGVKTKLEPIDEVIGAMLPGKLIVIGGRPGMGKSILAMNLARAAAEGGVPADYLCGEMDDDEMAARAGTDIDFDFAQRERLDPLQYGDFISMRATAHEMYRMAAAGQRLEELDLEFVDASGMTIEWIEAFCRRRCRARPGHRVVVVDHLQLVDWDQQPRGTQLVRLIREVTKRLKSLAKALGITIILLSQLSRDIDKRDDKYPQMTDFRESGSIEEDADIIIGIMRPLRYADRAIKAAKNAEQRHEAILAYDDAIGVLEAALLKNRGGKETGYFKLFIDQGASAVRSQKPDVAPVDGELDYGQLEQELRA